jgi:preprotein translocase subunit SecA
MLENILAQISQRELYNYHQIVKKINKLEDAVKILSNEELKGKTIYLKSLVKEGRSLNEILPEAFAIVREASFRVLGLRHYDVQLVGGCILHDGKIAEMKTGEGKTLVAILPAYLNALTGNSVHIVTVNEYLAKRDSVSVGGVLNFLGLTIGLISEEMNQETRQKNYDYDVIYATNSEIGFDYLRDNMATKTSEKVQKGFSFAIVDEVDSVLIDEARTPLIISQSFKTPESKYLQAKNVSEVLKKDMHYEIDNKSRNIFLTEDGVEVVEQLLGVQSLYKFERPLALYILNAIRAKVFYTRNKDYLVMDNQISIIDAFTGRVLSGRRWGEGLHQAIEAKEGVPIESETISLASITYQNFFLLYGKLAGMTGTAFTERREFTKIYNLSVYCIPTNKKIMRLDESDAVYKSLYAKWKAVLYECLKIHSQGRPILIGTSSVENSEIISELLSEYNIKHNLLNAKPENATKESEIVAQAGRKYAVTIATNMAGRGTDILLGGNPSFLAKSDLKLIIKSGFNIDNKASELFLSGTLIEEVNEIYKKSQIENTVFEQLIESLDSLMKPSNSLEETVKKIYQEVKSHHEKVCNLEKEGVVKIGGLHIIGTERNESRRIDNQLRGRAGRQGDPGSSKFFLSFEDNLLQVFGGEPLKKLLNQVDLDDDDAIKGNMISSGLDSAQQKIEDLNFETRKRLFNYDNVLNSQRKVIYTERNRILSLSDFKNLISEYLEKTVDDTIKEIKNCTNPKRKNEILGKFHKRFICLPYIQDLKCLENKSIDELRQYLNEQIKVSYELKELELESLQLGLSQSIEFSFLLQSIDQVWQDHLSRMDLLKENIGWRSYGQRDPLLEYQKEAYRLFSKQTMKIRQNVSFLVMGTTSFA